MNDNMSLTDRLERIRALHTRLRDAAPDEVVVIMGPTTVLIIDDDRIDTVEGYTIEGAAEQMFRNVWPVLVKHWGYPDGGKP